MTMDLYKNYYTAEIPYELALKLKDKGADFIEVDDEVFNSGTQDEYTEYFCYNSYASVFDWFLNKGISISIHNQGISYAYLIGGKGETIFADTENAEDWFNVTNKAIEKALERI